MALFNQFPWTNFHELNLDWLLRKVAEMEQAFPEGTIGIPKGGTGATTAEDARANLGVYGINIPLSSLDSTTIDAAIQDVAGDLDELMEALNYKLYKSVASLPGQVAGTATVSNCWNAMSQGEILLAPPDQFYPGECPETYGTLIMIRSGATSGYCLFAGGDHLYKKTFSGNTPLAGWQQVYTDSDIIPIANGGTGADNAADAVQNLGIDFSGTVLSVAGVGADPNGNVPLTLDALTITSLSEISVTPGSVTGLQAFNALGNGTQAFLAPTEINDAPANTGVLQIYKIGAGAGSVLLTANTGAYRMDVATGDWTELGAAGQQLEWYIRQINSTVPASAQNAVLATPGINASGGISTISLAWADHPDHRAVAIVGVNRSGTGSTVWNWVSYYISGSQTLEYAIRALSATSASNTMIFNVLYLPKMS